GVLALRIDSSVGIDRFVDDVLALHPEPSYNSVTGPGKSVFAAMPEARNFLPAPNSDREQARLEIRALLSLGRACDSPLLELDLMEDALWQSLTHFGDGSGKTRDIRASLCKMYVRVTEVMQSRLDAGATTD